MNRIRAALLAALLVLPWRADAQDIPPYVPANPVLASRSALYAQPYVSIASGTQWRFIADYYNAVEVSESPPPVIRQYLFDAEVLQADLWVTHALSRRVFVIANVPIRGAYDGFLDGFLNWYHSVIGLGVPARNERPENEFTWSFALPDSSVERAKAGTFIGDARAGIGIRFGPAQLVASVTLPTGSIGASGWTRKVVGTSLSLTAEALRNSRFVIDMSASAGYTPAQGALAAFQRTTFASALLGGKWRFAGEQSMFSSFWFQSGNWKNTGFGAMDDAEVSMDFGFLLHVHRRWPELQLGMTQDLVPKGPAMDVGFTVGLRW